LELRAQDKIRQLQKEIRSRKERLREMKMRNVNEIAVYGVLLNQHTKLKSLGHSHLGLGAISEQEQQHIKHLLSSKAVVDSLTQKERGNIDMEQY